MTSTLFEQKSANPQVPESGHAERHTQRIRWTAAIEKTMRMLACAVLAWSLGGLVFLYLTVSPQPRKFMPLVIRESDSEESRQASINVWRDTVFPKNTQPLLGDRPPMVSFNLDARLSKRQLEDSEIWYWHQASYADDKRTFKERLFDLNVEVEHFFRDYWTRAWQLLESLSAVALASVACIVFRRILPSSILFMISTLAFFLVYNEIHMGLPTFHWIAPILGSSIAIAGLAIIRWWIAPASAEVTSDWNKLWLGLLLTSIGLGVSFALVVWGGRVSHKGLAGLGLCIGWGVHLVAVHSWKLTRALFTKPTESLQ